VPFSNTDWQWPSGDISLVLPYLNNSAAQLRVLLLILRCLCICSSTCFCRNLCLHRRPTNSLKNRSVPTTPFGTCVQFIWEWNPTIVKNKYRATECVLCLTVWCFFDSCSLISLPNSTPYFIPSKRDAVCLHFTSTHNWPTLNFRPNSSQQSRWCSFMSVNLLFITLHHSLQYSWIDNTEVVNLILTYLLTPWCRVLLENPKLIRSLPTPCNTVTTGSSSPHSFVTVSECVAKYIHWLFTNWAYIALLTQLISSHSFRNIPNLLNQFYSSGFFRIIL